MNARYLSFTLALLIVVGLAIRSRSTLTPERGINHVFYGGYSDFMAQEVIAADFNNDGDEDVVTSLLWDQPGGCNASPQSISSFTACANSFTRWVATKGLEDTVICGFPDPDLAEVQRAYWEDECGWTIVDTLSCGQCWQAVVQSENEGALHIVMGGDWSGKGHDIDLATTPSDHMVVGQYKGDNIYNGMAAGNVDGDSYIDLIVGASQRNNGGPGEVYVIAGGTSWPDTLRPPGDAAYYFLGRDDEDAFGLGIASGDLNDDGKADVVIAAPYGDGPSNGRTNCGEIYILYSVGSLPTTVDLSTLSDAQLGTSTYAQVIWGATANDSTGVTVIRERHEHNNGRGDYEPTGLAIGDWNGDGFNDLVIGAGSAGGSPSTYRGKDGVAYVIFGAATSDATRKLRPGKTIDLSNTVGTSSAADLRIVGKDRSALGAGVAFIDADGEGPSGKDDLFLGAPYSVLGGDTLNRDYKGEVYVIWGDTKANLTGNANRDAADGGDTDVTIIGQDGNDQIGGHMSGNRDIDGDGKNDFGIAGQNAVFVFFGQSRGDWESEIDLATVIDDEPDTRILKWASVDPEANSMTIKLAQVNGDTKADLVFGGYDLPGINGQAYPDQLHAGQMWMMNGSSVWKNGTISTDQTWSGNVFVDGDVVVTGNHTLTIAAGTTVWAWPHDALKNGLGIDTIRVEIRINSGSLVVSGTEENPVIFQAWDDVDPETNASNKWFGIWIDDSGSANIDHAIIRNAYRGIQTRSDLELKNSIIEDCVYVGITLAGDSTNADSLYMYNTTVRRITDSGGIGVNILGKKAAANLTGCIVRDCAFGIATYSKAKLYATGAVVTNTTTQALEVTSRGRATLTGGTFESDGKALSITNGGTVYAGLTEFKNSVYGVWIEKDGASTPSAEFAECDMDSNSAGIQISGVATVELDQCLIANSDDDGVYCVSGADIDITGCTIGGNGASAVLCDDSDPTIDDNILSDSVRGVKCVGTASPLLDDNYIADNNGGVVCEDYANPSLRRNKIWNNNNGISFIDNADAVLDHCSGSPPCANGNSFKGNSGYHLTNFTSTTIDAECNYWGKTTPSAAKFYGPVDYTPYLSGDPLPVSARPAEPEPAAKLPKVYRLTGNSPNPFNPATTIRYEVPPPGGHVRIRVYNVQGQLVRTLVDQQVAAGYQQVAWDGSSDRGTDIASGIYFVQMSAPGFQMARKMVLLK